MNEYRLIFDYLHSLGLNYKNLIKKGIKIKGDEFIRFKNKLIELTQIEPYSSDSQFNFFTNSTQSGNSLHFNDQNFRISQIESLLSSSLLYCDTIWIKNPLDNYIFSEESYFDENGKREFLYDVQLLYHFKNGLEDGLIKICYTPTHFCRHCLIDSLDKIPPKYKSGIDKLDKYLIDRFRKGANFELKEIDGENCEILITANENDLYPLEKYQLNYSAPEEFKKSLESPRGTVYQNELKKSYLLNCEFADPILNDIIMYDWFSDKYNLNLFTNREVDLELVKLLNNEETNLRSNKLINGLKHNYTFLKNVPSDKLLELRKNEPEAFNQYRDTLDKLLRDAPNLTEVQLKEAIRDEVNPNLNSIDSILKKHKKKLSADLLTSVLYCSASIGIGLFTGILPEKISLQLAALGIANHGGDTVRNLVKILNKENEVLDEKYYFLWKLRKQGSSA